MGKKIFVATDGSDVSNRALDWAAEAVRGGGELVLVNVAEEFCPVGVTEIDCDTVEAITRKESEGIVAAAVEYLAGKGVQARVIVGHGAPADEIVRLAGEEQADQIVLGAHGRHGMKRLALGSVSGRVVEWAPCVVTVVK